MVMHCNVILCNAMVMHYSVMLCNEMVMHCNVMLCNAMAMHCNVMLCIAMFMCCDVMFCNEMVMHFNVILCNAMFLCCNVMLCNAMVMHCNGMLHNAMVMYCNVIQWLPNLVCNFSKMNLIINLELFLKGLANDSNLENTISYTTIIQKNKNIDNRKKLWIIIIHKKSLSYICSLGEFQSTLYVNK